MASGLRCSSCNCPRYKLLRTDRRSYHYFGDIKKIIRRRYACEHCGHRWWTNEILEEDAEKFIENHQSP